MRYTAKARMLAFDFLCDDVVYGRLSLQGVVILSGMIARADNLGRLPGEPEVLRSYLFSPRPPRSDITLGDVLEVLGTLAAQGRVHWYTVQGAAFVQFARWGKHQPGIKEANRKSTLPGPDAEGAQPVEQASLFTDVPLTGKVLDIAALQRAVREQVGHQRRALDYDSAWVTRWMARNGVRDKDGIWYAFGEWLSKTGAVSEREVSALLSAALTRGPGNRFAYLAPGSEAREAVVRSANARAAEAENEAFKKEPT